MEDSQYQSLCVRLSEVEKRVDEIQKNTAELIGVLNSWKGAMRVLEVIGKIAKPLAAIIALGSAIWGWFHVGGPK